MYVLNLYSNSQLLYAGVAIKDRVVVGRDDSCDISITEPSISRTHLSIEIKTIGSQVVLFLRDEGSRNGVFVNSQKVLERIISPGDLIRFGCCQIDVLRIAVPQQSMEGERKSETVFCRWTPSVGSAESANRLRALYSMALSLADLEIPFMLEKAAEIVRNCVDFDQFSFLLEGKRGMVLCTTWNSNGPCGRDEVKVDHSVIRASVQLGEPLVSGPSKKGEEESTNGAIASVPLIAGGRTLGILYCSTTDSGRPFSQEDVQFLTLVACFVASGISHRWNLSDVQKTAAKLEAILGSLEHGVLVCDPDFRVLSANHAARAVFHRYSLVSLGIVEILEDTEHNFDAKTIQMRKSFDFDWTHEEEGVTKRRSYHAKITSTAGLDNEGWVHIVCIQDVTELVRDERMHLALVNRVGHKLRTPLTVVSSAIEIMSNYQEIDPEDREIVRRAKHNCSELERVVVRFVESIAVDTGKKTLSWSVPVSLAYLVDQAFQVVREDLITSGVEFENALAKSALELLVVPEKLCECFVQVLDNSRKFAGSGAKVVLDGELSESELVLRFTDNGPGIHKDELREVTDLFHQTDLQDTGEVPGMGIGLWWVREVLRSHGGDMHLRSPIEEGHGLSVEFVLPTSVVVQSGHGEETAHYEYDEFLN
ncbi:MAG: FHA domain-containing protein [Planctomycetota bacterium]